MVVSEMGEKDSAICQTQLELVCRRLETLDKIEAKLLEMRELATYAANQKLSQQELAQIQEQIDSLKADINALDKKTPQIHECLQKVEISLKN